MCWFVFKHVIEMHVHVHVWNISKSQMAMLVDLYITSPSNHVSECCTLVHLTIVLNSLLWVGLTVVGGAQILS